jgi:hypothetical protein
VQVSASRRLRDADRRASEPEAGVAGSACPPGIADELVDQMLSMTSRTSTRSMVTAADG